MKQIAPMLMFSGERHGRAEEALEFYTSTFPDSSITSIERYGPGGQGREGTVEVANFVLNGQPFMAMDSPISHAFNFTPSISFFVTVSDLDEFEGVFTKMSPGAKLLMPPDDYGFSRRFVWLDDSFGVSWQINCQ